MLFTFLLSFNYPHHSEWEELSPIIDGSKTIEEESELPLDKVLEIKELKLSLEEEPKLFEYKILT